ncbi:MAG: hypothetical protein LBN27_03165 [Prevotellaceae bacterium]|jgi:hypothetical protein|nr:hypothetical protein [Prevotellaceae bacterium]
MKKILFYLMLALSVATAASMMTACGDDKEDPTDPYKEAKEACAAKVYQDSTFTWNEEAHKCEGIYTGQPINFAELKRQEMQQFFADSLKNPDYRNVFNYYLKQRPIPYTNIDTAEVAQPAAIRAAEDGLHPVVVTRANKFAQMGQEYLQLIK